MHNLAYVRPKSIDDAFSLMEGHGEWARYIAADRDILVKIKEKTLFSDFLISLRHIPELAPIRCQKDKRILGIRIFDLPSTPENSEGPQGGARR